MPDSPAYELEFYAEEGGAMPALRWIKEDLSPNKRRALGMAMNEVLQRHGVQVVGERSWGRQHGGSGRAQAFVAAEAMTSLSQRYDITHQIMSTDFAQLIADIEQEARDEGPRAVRELERFREEFGLAGQLIASRREGKLSQRDLAKLSGVPQSEISRIETGAGNPTYATITALLRPLGKRIQLVDDRPSTT